jgi:hypothetical protein
MKEATDQQLDVVQAKARPRGTLPYLPDRQPELLRQWLTRALRPIDGMTVQNFARAGRDPKDPATLTLSAGRDVQTYRITRQGDLTKALRTTLVSLSDGKLEVPHLTGGEVEDVWVALCQLGEVLTEWDERDEARKWVEQMLLATLPLMGHTLVPDGRHDALMAIKHAGEFTRGDALALIRPSNDNGHSAFPQSYQQRPCRFVDEQTGEQWLRAGEVACYVRWVVGIEPLAHATLRARLHEVGVIGKHFEDYRAPHPKLNLYQLPEELTEPMK